MQNRKKERKMIALFVDLKATFDTANRQIGRNKKRIVCGRGKNLRKNRLVEKLNRNAHSIRFCILHIIIADLGGKLGSDRMDNIRLGDIKLKVVTNVTT